MFPLLKSFKFGKAQFKMLYLVSLTLHEGVVGVEYVKSQKY